MYYRRLKFEVFWEGQAPTGTRESAATRRVGACLDSFRISLRILRTQRVQPGPAHSAKSPTKSDLSSPGASNFGPKSIEKSIQKLMSFWSRFWCLLGPFWPPFWHLFRSLSLPDRPWTPILFKNVDVHETMVKQTKNTLFSPPDRPQDDPKSAQIASKRLLFRF